MMVRGLESLGNMSAEETARTLLLQRAALRAARDYRMELEAVVKAQEARYNILSSEIHAAIDRGELVETADVARWIMAYESLTAIRERET